MTMTTSRRFFSGDSLRQALIAAANHFNLDPEEIAYRAIEKRHGFLKTRRRVVIEVDPDAPRRSEPAPIPAEPAPAAAITARPAALAEAPAPRPAVVPLRNERAAGPEAGRPREREAPERRDRSHHDDRGHRGHRDERPRRGDRRDEREGRRRGPDGGREPRAPRPPGPPRQYPAGPEPEATPPASPGLIALPEAPRRTSERFPIATGAAAEAAAKAIEIVLDVAGLDLAARIHQGEERLEVELYGADTDPCFSDGGELLMAIEHLLPRLIRGLCGETVACRVDCDSFHEIRAEQLRSLAQNVANEVRRLGRARTLDPMNPSDRRIIHMTLADDPAVVTESDGQGYFKRVTVRPA